MLVHLSCQLTHCKEMVDRKLCTAGCHPGHCAYAQPFVVPAGTFPVGSRSGFLVGLCCSIPLQLRYAADPSQHPVSLCIVTCAIKMTIRSCVRVTCMLCYAMLCYAMLCYAVLCCAVLCCHAMHNDGMRRRASVGSFIHDTGQVTQTCDPLLCIIIIKTLSLQ